MQVNNFFRKLNKSVHEYKGDLPLWVISERLGIHENTLRGWLRQKLSKEREESILIAISKIRKEIQQKL
ncbi:hypothetical protein [Bacillus mycoides]|uniref:hypothetical protein n=1 Tax=Bacillus mycoides TaxID=1405 RepID=UPI00211389AF|nr:hypothetical protein [Bacillus mycoides]MCQ6530740.1 hypothetical protein [Bacillus mycoides]